MNEYQKHDTFVSDKESYNELTHMDCVTRNSSRDCSWSVYDTEDSSHCHISAAPVVRVCTVLT